VSERRSGGRGLAYSVLILLALGVMLVLQGPRDTGARPTAPVTAAAQPEAEDSLSRRQITRIAVQATPEVARRVAKIRGLAFDHVPKPEVVSSEYLNRLGEREAGADGGLGGISVGEAEGRITGLLAPDEQLENAVGSTGDLAAAAYDPETERLYIVRDAGGVPNRALIEFLLSHELDHALEDQNFGIGGGGHLDGDAALARQALIEGLATSVMQDYGTRYLNPFDLLAGANGIDTDTHGVPQFLVDELTWTYLGGDDFINSLRRIAEGWKLVDYALGSRPPATTEQVLHVDKYIKDELPEDVVIEPSNLTEGGYERVDRADLGELQTSDLLEVGADTSDAETAAAGWNGDSYELWRGPGAKLRDCVNPCRDGLILIIRWSWDELSDAGEFDRAARDYVEDGLDGKGVAPGVWSLGPTAVAAGSAGTTSALVFAPTEALARALVTVQMQGSAP
jgi:hypothetical protein